MSVCHQPLASKLSVTVVQARNLPKISNYGIGGKDCSFTLKAPHPNHGLLTLNQVITGFGTADGVLLCKTF